MTKMNSISESIVFVGKRPHHEIPTWLSATDCLVIPSLSEGFPTLLPEAMLNEVPIVATNVGGIPEILHDMVTGILVPPKDQDMLADGIIRLLNNKKLARQLALRAKKIALSKLTWEFNAQRTFDFYQSICTNYR